MLLADETQAQAAARRLITWGRTKILSSFIKFRVTELVRRSETMVGVQMGAASLHNSRSMHAQMQTALSIVGFEGGPVS